MCEDFEHLGYFRVREVEIEGFGFPSGALPWPMLAE